MRKLNGVDASFLYNETPNTPQHVGGIQYLSVPEDRQDTFVDDLRAVLLDRIHLLPYLTQRVQFVPWDLDHPVWVRATSFDIDDHLFTHTLPAPGTQDQLEALCADIYEAPLDRKKPLWEMWVISGLADGSVAVLSKTHHACLDGMASISVGEILGDFTETPRDVEPAQPEFWQAEDTRPETLWRDSWFNLMRYNIDEWARRPAREAAQRRLEEYRIAAAAELPASAPRAPWNARVTSKRSVAGAVFSLSDLKELGKANGVKINDVILCITSMAVREYLEAREIRLDRPLIANCPVSLRKPDDTTMNNQITNMNVSLENHVDDPLLRLSSIGAAARTAKEMLATLGDTVVTDFGGAFLPAQMQQWTRATANGEFAEFGNEVPANLVVSNVPGLREQVYMAGAKVIGTTPMSIVAHGAGLNVTVTSYLDRMDLGLTAATSVVPDLPALRDDFVNAYETLLALTFDEPADATDDMAVA